MKTLDRYVGGLFLKAFFGSLAAVSFLFTVLSILDSLTYQLEKEGVTAWDVIHFYLLLLPQTIFMGAPIAALISAMITLGAMNQNHEIMALRAAGISVARTSAPILLASLGISVGLFFSGRHAGAGGGQVFQPGPRHRRDQKGRVQRTGLVCKRAPGLAAYRAEDRKGRS